MLFEEKQAAKYRWLNKILPGIANLMIGKKIISVRTDKEKVYLVSEEVFQVFRQMKKHPYSIGFFFVELLEDEVKFSLGTAEKYAKLKRKTIIASKYGEEKFLYNRNLMKKHVVSCTEDIIEGDMVVVVNQQGDALGFGRALFSAKEIAKKEGALVKNISDKGFFVKH